MMSFHVKRLSNLTYIKLTCVRGRYLPGGVGVCRGQRGVAFQGVGAQVGHIRWAQRDAPLGRDALQDAAACLYTTKINSHTLSCYERHAEATTQHVCSDTCRDAFIRKFRTLEPG